MKFDKNNKVEEESRWGWKIIKVWKRNNWCWNVLKVKILLNVLCNDPRSHTCYCLFICITFMGVFHEFFVSFKISFIRRIKMRDWITPFYVSFALWMNKNILKSNSQRRLFWIFIHSFLTLNVWWKIEKSNEGRLIILNLKIIILHFEIWWNFHVK